MPAKKKAKTPAKKAAKHAAKPDAPPASAAVVRKIRGQAEDRPREDPQAPEAGAEVPGAQPGERGLPAQGGLLPDPRQEEGAHADGGHGQDLRPDPAHDGVLQGAGRDRRHRHQARGLLRVEELGGGAVQRAARERRGDGGRRGAVRHQPRAARLHPRGEGRRRRRAAGGHRPRPRDRRGAADRLHPVRLRRLLDPHLGRAALLRDQGEVHPRHRDRRHVPAAGQAHLLAHRQLHPGLDGRRAHPRLPPLHPPAGRREEASRSTSSSTATPTASPTSTAPSRSARATPPT